MLCDPFTPLMGSCTSNSFISWAYTTSCISCWFLISKFHLLAFSPRECMPSLCTPAAISELQSVLWNPTLSVAAAIMHNTHCCFLYASFIYLFIILKCFLFFLVARKIKEGVIYQYKISKSSRSRQKPWCKWLKISLQYTDSAHLRKKKLMLLKLILVCSL